MNDATTQADFVRLFSANQRRIQTFILTLLPDRDQAQDVMQNTSVVLWQKFETFQPGTDFTAWAFRIARLEVLSLVRRQGKGRLVFDESICNGLADEITDRDAISDSRLRALEGCVKKLSAVDRDLLQRRYEEGATIKAVAEAVGRPLEGMYKAMRRIHRTLFECTQRKLSATDESVAT
ncbi:RNA polymerase sigma factor [Stieleria neptunia]|uniref:RNA polymerase sigma factor n=1 Tax=Stieleria neptunia TaxID=2527979 RepID=A0A518HIC3_9BACT|nr:sigma-70 family RNA polymerase sigma factor [Stieleria neptunia]QDV40605.1 RNA polymerase sigma factor [Stieleria neptunia]